MRRPSPPAEAGFEAGPEAESEMVAAGWAAGRTVHLGAAGRPVQPADSELARAVLDARPRGRRVPELVAWAESIGVSVPEPGSGRTRARWEVMATVAAEDLVAARVLEPHLDALAILAEAGNGADPDLDRDRGSWGVWAAEGPGARLVAERHGRDWRLRGTKPWCSLAGQVTGGLVTAWVDDEVRGLFAVDTRHPGFRADDQAWQPAGLAEIATATVTMDDVTARPVGAPGWYLRRAGFAWGGLGVAAVWYGGAVGVARRVVAEAGRRRPDDIALLHLGELDACLGAARAALAEAADEIDAGRADAGRCAVLAARVRHIVAHAAEEVLTRAAHALGPGPLSQEPDHVRRVADLALYLRQHHAERDAVSLGRMLLQATSTNA